MLYEVITDEGVATRVVAVFVVPPLQRRLQLGSLLRFGAALELAYGVVVVAGAEQRQQQQADEDDGDAFAGGMVGDSYNFV